MRIVGSDIYGQYSFILSQCNLIVALGFGWLNQAKLRYYSTDSFNKNYYYSQKIALFYSLIFCLLFLAILVFYQSLSNLILVVSIILIASMGFYTYLKTLYQAKLLPKKIVILTSIQSLLALVLPIAIMYFFGYNEISLLIGITFSFLFAIIILLKTKIISMFFVFDNKLIRKSNKLIKKWLAYGAPLSLWFTVGLALSFLDRFFINYYLPSNELGIYASLQELLTRSFSLTLFPLTMALHPRIMKLWNSSKLHDTTQLITKSIITIFSIGIFIILFVWLFKDLIFLGLQKIIPAFSVKSKMLILPLLSAGFLWQLSLITHKMIELKEQTKLMIIAILPSLIINLVGNTIFLPTLGGIATAYTSLFSALSYFIITSIHCAYSINKIKIS